ncbi:MAG: DUF5009 domain-containing protein [Fidelibacterota bacterium]|nr:MAG: DUF5009 domain-containing protein [Candidatus Neomarinimicrobiota bacterium]
MGSLKQRLTSLDAFRGLTIVGMILINNPGSWSYIYAPLRHAEWNGQTPTDWVFPFFLFIMGVAMALSLRVRIESGQNRAVVWLKILKRTILLFALGLALSAFRTYSVSLVRFIIIFLCLFVLGVAVWLYLRFRFEDSEQRNAAVRRMLNGALPFVIIGVILAGCYSFNFATARIPGVLQRIAVCYLVVSAVLVLFPRLRDQWLLMGGLILAYLLIMYGLDVPGHGRGVLTPEGHASGYIDRLVLGENHIWRGSKIYDPEGLVSTLPAILSVFLGLQFGGVIIRFKSHQDRVFQWLLWGSILLITGILLDYVIPINKQLWTPSYSIFMAGLAGLFLGIIYWLIEIKEWKKWSTPFIMLGMNPLIIFWMSGFMVRNLILVKIATGDGESSVWSLIYTRGFTTWLPDYPSSLAFALANVAFWLLVAWGMYRWRWFVKI